MFLYELYHDKRAFDAHVASRHFKAFDAVGAAMIAERSVELYSRVEPPPVIHG